MGKHTDSLINRWVNRQTDRHENAQIISCRNEQTGVKGTNGHTDGPTDI
jgi:hypothetical protein